MTNEENWGRDRLRDVPTITYSWQIWKQADSMSCCHRPPILSPSGPFKDTLQGTAAWCVTSILKMSSGVSSSLLSAPSGKALCPLVLNHFRMWPTPSLSNQSVLSIHLLAGKVFQVLVGMSHYSQSPSSAPNLALGIHREHKQQGPSFCGHLPWQGKPPVTKWTHTRHWPRVAPEHIKRGYCDWGKAEFFISFNYFKFKSQ